MITIEQTRAARGLLGWTQQDLADASGLSKTAINNFEKNKSAIKIDSLRAIQIAFETLGIEFIGEDGVARKKERTQTLKGPLAFQLLLEDIRSEIRTSKNAEILVSNALVQHIEQIDKIDASARFLCSEDSTISNEATDTNFKHSPDISKNSQTLFLYADKLGIQLFGGQTIILTKNKDAYTAERKRFEMLWERKSESQQKSTSKDSKVI